MRQADADGLCLWSEPAETALTQSWWLAWCLKVADDEAGATAQLQDHDNVACCVLRRNHIAAHKLCPSMLSYYDMA